MQRFLTRDQALLGQVLTGRTGHPDIKLHLSDKLIRISAALALRMIQCAEYEWAGTPRRVYYMRPVNIRPWQACYRTCASATIQPSLEWMQRLLTHNA
jgi:hypothetical protein